MNWSELQQHWQHRNTDTEFNVDTGRTLWQKVHWRDGLETGVALLLMPLFALSAWSVAQDGLWFAAGSAVFLIGALAFIPWQLRRARQRIPKPDPGRPVREFLQAEREALAAQASLLRHVGRWYYGPIAIGVIGFFGGIQGLTLPTLVYSLLVIALCAVVEWLNRRAVRREFLPALDQVETQLNELSVGSES